MVRYTPTNIPSEIPLIWCYTPCRNLPCNRHSDISCNIPRNMSCDTHPNIPSYTDSHPYMPLIDPLTHFYSSPHPSTLAPPFLQVTPSQHMQAFDQAVKYGGRPPIDALDYLLVACMTALQVCQQPPPNLFPGSVSVHPLLLYTPLRHPPPLHPYLMFTLLPLPVHPFIINYYTPLTSIRFQPSPAYNFTTAGIPEVFIWVIGGSQHVPGQPICRGLLRRSPACERFVGANRLQHTLSYTPFRTSADITFITYKFLNFLLSSSHTHPLMHRFIHL